MDEEFNFLFYSQVAGEPGSVLLHLAVKFVGYVRAARRVARVSLPQCLQHSCERCKDKYPVATTHHSRSLPRTLKVACTQQIPINFYRPVHTPPHGIVNIPTSILYDLHSMTSHSDTRSDKKKKPDGTRIFLPEINAPFIWLVVVFTSESYSPRRQ